MTAYNRGRKKKKTVVLHNMFMPIWLLWFFPVTWIIILPGNFVFDLLILALGMKICRVQRIGQQLKKSIVKTWLFGFVADFMGMAPLFLPKWYFDFRSEQGETGGLVETVYNAVWYDPFQTAASFLIVTLGVVVSIVFIFIFNYYFALKKTELSRKEKKRTALILAVVTAPWMFYFPTLGW
ncbi:MAG: hypothetical protein J1F02_05390 [Lachnospiraceae bacterium]|nr:hypothetical protein [Lachnospiraceae bacterium]